MAGQPQNFSEGALGANITKIEKSMRQKIASFLVIFFKKKRLKHLFFIQNLPKVQKFFSKKWDLLNIIREFGNQIVRLKKSNKMYFFSKNCSPIEKFLRTPLLETNDLVTLSIEF